MTLSEIRKQIDACDEQIIRLLNERADHVHEVGPGERAEGRDLCAGAGGAGLRSLAAKAREMQSRLPEQSIRRDYREIFSASLALEKDLTHPRISGGGDEYAPGGAVAVRDLREIRGAGDDCGCFDAVARGQADYGVVPSEKLDRGR